MAVLISLLRGINVSGQNKLSMADLKQLYLSLGLENVQTYVQSGNVVFTSEESDELAIARLIEAGILEQFGYTVPVFIRSPREFERILSGNPFLHGRQEDPAFLHVTFLYEAASMIKLSNLTGPNPGEDEFAPGEREIYLFCPGGYGKTKLSNTYFERKLKVSATTRNWKTINALFDLVRMIDQS